MTDEDNQTGGIAVFGVTIPELFARMGCSLARHSVEKLGEIEAIRLEPCEGTKISESYTIPRWMLSVDFVNNHDPETCWVCQDEKRTQQPEVAPSAIS